MVYKALQSMLNWATQEQNAESRGPEYLTALRNLCDAIRTVMKFH